MYRIGNVWYRQTEMVIKPDNNHFPLFHLYRTIYYNSRDGNVTIIQCSRKSESEYFVVYLINVKGNELLM